MLYTFTEAGRETWASKIKVILFSLGFGEVWMQQQIGNYEHFVVIFHQRVVDCAHQDWASSLQSKKSLKYFSSFKFSVGKEMYLESINSFKLRRALAKFRCGVLFNRHKKVVISITDENITHYKELCKWCQKESQMEIANDEYHIFYECPMYNSLREKHLPKYF